VLDDAPTPRILDQVRQYGPHRKVSFGRHLVERALGREQYPYRGRASQGCSPSGYKIVYRSVAGPYPEEVSALSLGLADMSDRRLENDSPDASD
jgi:hypothetical protein